MIKIRIRDMLLAIGVILFVVIFGSHIIDNMNTQMDSYCQEHYGTNYTISECNFTTLNQLTWDKCCHGNYCTDTYYSRGDNLCHLSACNTFKSLHRNNCTYIPEGDKEA